MLVFNGTWRFDSPGPISEGVAGDFLDLIWKVAAQGARQQILEHFKGYFAHAVGSSHMWSSNESWAESDLNSYIEHAAKNAPVFIEAFYDACESLQKSHPGISVPDVNFINRVLLKNNANYEIDPPNLISRNPHAAIAIPSQATSLDAQAQEIIQQSPTQSEQFLSEGRNRQAVQEIVWLLETVSTAFKGLDAGSGTVQGKYFNKIAGDLRKHNKGTTLDQVLGWITILHGYLSSPTGGGIRHGADLKSGAALQHDDARLFCNLIRSYIAYLIAEYERLNRG